MGQFRKRFNEKARTGMLAKQAALKKIRGRQFTRHEDDGREAQEEAKEPVDASEDLTTLFNNGNSNSEILTPMSVEEKEDRKRKLEESLYTANARETKMSRSKKKRLDKYIEHQIKREEKKTLMEKLSQTKMDPTLLVASKILGKGKQTRREEIVEALALEKQGRGDEHTKDVLYEEHEVKDWTKDDVTFPVSYDKLAESESEEGSASDGSEDNGSEDEFGGGSSSFVDNRPAKFGGSGTGFGFANLPKIHKASKAAKKKYSWRLKVEKEERKKLKIEDENDFNSTEESEEDDESEEVSDLEEINPELAELILASKEDEKELEAEQKPSRRINRKVESSEEEEENEDEEGEDDSEDEDDDDEEDSDDDSEEDSEEDSEDESRLMLSKPKHSKKATSFKDWAEQQVRQLEGRETVLEMPVLSTELKEQYSKPTLHEEDADASSDEEGYIRIDKSLQRDSFYVPVTRDTQIQEQRSQLPVFAEEHRIMEAVNHHDCIVICGETGSGKTTQVPQFLYEAGFGNLKHDLYPGMIGVTQPRRVAAVSMAGRVGNELGDHSNRVGYQIRFDTTIKNEGQENGTALKFMTDGVLLREMMTDFMLKKYSCIIIDEAHERNINTDILIGMLSRVLKLRREFHEKDPKNKPLKLIIMSATLRVSDFSENSTLFKTPPPIIKVDARQYPVSVHFNKRTHFEYLDEAAKKAAKIHKKLPPGGILIFLTGQQEITTTVKRLRKEFPFPDKSNTKDIAPIVRLNKQTDAEAEDIEFSVNGQDLEQFDDYESGSEEEEEGFDEEMEEHQSPNDPLYVLPLYSLLPTKEQMRVFENPPPGSRLCIVATNVAETSLTIPGVRYVVDCGRAKERKFNEDTGVQSFEVDWVSKASADQRAGRAGRTGPGHCYRLYSSAIYESYFPQFSRPEILRMPFESVVLSMKSMGIDNVANFPFPTPPDRAALQRAEKLLVFLGALDRKLLNITDLGKTMALFPLSPRFAKILIVGNQQGCLPYVIAIVSALSVGDPFIGENELGLSPVEKKHRKQREDGDSDVEREVESEDEDVDVEAKKKMRSRHALSRAMFSKLDRTSDAFMLLSAVCAIDHVPKEKRNAFVKENFLRAKVMEEILKLRKQVDHIVKVNTMPDSIALAETAQVKLGVPDKKQLLALKQMIASGFLDQVSIRADLVLSDFDLPKKTIAINVPYAPVFPVHNNNAETDPYCYIHPGSVITTLGSMPGPYLIYQSLNTSANTKEGRAPKVRMRPLVEISGKQLTNISKNSPLLTYSKPLGHPYAPKNITSVKRECYVVPRFGAAIGSGGIGWDLPAMKVIQVKKNGLWVIE